MGEKKMFNLYPSDYTYFVFSGHFERVEEQKID